MYYPNNHHLRKIIAKCRLEQSVNYLFTTNRYLLFLIQKLRNSKINIATQTLCNIFYMSLEFIGFTLRKHILPLEVDPVSTNSHL